MQNFSPVVSFCGVIREDSSVMNRLQIERPSDIVIQGCGHKVVDHWVPGCYILARSGESDEEIFAIIKNDLYKKPKEDKPKGDPTGPDDVSDTTSESSSSRKTKKARTRHPSRVHFVIYRLTYGCYERDVYTTINPPTTEKLRFFSSTSGKTMRSPFQNAPLNDTVMHQSVYELTVHTWEQWESTELHDFSRAVTALSRAEDKEVWPDNQVYDPHAPTLNFPEMVMVNLRVPKCDEAQLLSLCNRLSFGTTSTSAEEVLEILKSRDQKVGYVPSTMTTRTVAFRHTQTQVYNAHGYVTDWHKTSYFASHRQQGINLTLGSVVVDVAAWAINVDFETRVLVEVDRRHENEMQEHLAVERKTGWLNIFSKPVVVVTLVTLVRAMQKGASNWTKDWRDGYRTVGWMVHFIALPSSSRRFISPARSYCVWG
jgi:hypothetical protein